MERNSQAASFDSGQRTTVGAPEVRVRGGSAATTVEGGSNLLFEMRNNLAQSIANRAAGIGDRLIKQNQQELYAKGQLAAMAGEAEDDLEGNPLTRDWAVAGYRDTMGKLKQAELAAQLQQDMPELRTKSPAAMAEYLAAQRAQIMPQLEGMSSEQRIALMGTQLSYEQAAMKMHTAAYKDWIVEDTNTSIAASSAPKLAMLQSAQASGDAPAVQAAVEHAATFALDSILLKPQLKNLPQERNKILSQFVSASLDQKTPALYEYLRDTAFKVDGKEVNILGMLPLEEQAKLSRKYVEAKAEVRNQEFSWWHQQKAEILAATERDGVMPITGDQFRAFLDYGIRNRAISAAQAGDEWEKWLRVGYKNENTNALAQMYLAGDTKGMASLGKEKGDGAAALDLLLNRTKASPEDRIKAYLQAGSSGNTEALNKIGGIVSVAVSQLGAKEGTVAAQHAKTLEQVNAILDTANPTTQAMVLAGMPEATQLRLQRMRAFRSEGADPAMALASTLKLEQQEANMTPQQRAAVAGATASDDKKYIQQVDGVGVLRNLGLAVSSVWNPIDAARRVISPKDSWTGNTALVSDYAAEARAELGKEFSQIGMIRPGATAEEKMTIASARLASRTVKTDFGPVFMPKGQTSASVFKLPVAVPNEVVADAINTVFKDVADKGNGIVFKFLGNELRWQEVDAKGQRTSKSGVLDPSAVRDAIGIKEQSKLDSFNERSGTGKTVRGPDGFAMTYNGENSAGVEPVRMLQFRDNLVKNEGVRGTKYRDTLGVQTIGPGVSERSAYWPSADKPSRAEIENAFHSASSEAASVGAKLQDALGLRDNASFLLLSELAYHSGPNFHATKPYQEFLSTAMRARVGAADAAQVEAAFKKTKAWEVSGKERRTHYLSLIQQAMKG